MDKPVIIIGGGIVGSLLAYRLRETLPHIPFKIYEGTSSLGKQQSISFRQSDCERSISWLRPLIAHTWTGHQICFKKFDKIISHPYHLIDSKRLNEVVVSKLGADLKLNNKIPLEIALQEGSFVIDTRNECHYKKAGYKKTLSIEMELEEPHGILSPVVFDEKVSKKEIYRSLSYFPLSERTILIKDSWYSDNRNLDIDEMRRVLSSTARERNWKIKKVIREDSGVVAIPTSAPVFYQEGRVISLSGLFHETAASSIASITKLIDEMVATSFRYGELREIVSNFRRSEENVQVFYRTLNKQLIEEKQDNLFERIYDQPYSFIERFSRGNLNFFDRSRIVLSGLKECLNFRHSRQTQTLLES